MDTSHKEAPEVLASEDVFTGRVFTVSVDTVREGERTHKREVVRHPGSAAIVAVYDDGTVCLVRQYRHPTVKYLLEIPAGSRDEFESPEVCAARELEEELGVVAGNWEKLAEFFVSPGFCAEKMWVYLATDLTETERRPEDDEDLELVRLSFARAFEMIEANEIEDAKTIIGLQLAAQALGRE
ncbi:MAG: ADP-ribose pyrophosphatase [Acidobacteriota bacterium]|jgi:ADP-ribose pyrophosphatase|nr:ADP-ribose pyrophosphatase [Acidobacteriota bacterium]